jgi:hypothetical protein
MTESQYQQARTYVPLLSHAISGWSCSIFVLDNRKNLDILRDSVRDASPQTYKTYSFVKEFCTRFEETDEADVEMCIPIAKMKSLTPRPADLPKFLDWKQFLSDK